MEVGAAEEDRGRGESRRGGARPPSPRPGGQGRHGHSGLPPAGQHQGHLK